jgi:hypothetical protein
MTVLSFNAENRSLQLMNAEEIIARFASFLPASLQAELQAALAASMDDLQVFLEEKKSELLQRVPEDLQFLLEKLADFEDREISLVDYARDLQGASALTLGVSTGAKILLDRVTTDELDHYETLGLDVNDVLMQIGFRGHIGLHMQATGQTGLLKAGVELDAAKEQGLAYSLRLRKADYPLMVLPQLAESIVNPAELAALTRAMNEVELLRFERTGLNSIAVGLTVGIAREIKAELGAHSVATSTGAELALTWRDQGSLNLLLERLPNGSFILALEKQREVARSSKLKLGLDVEISGFKAGLLEEITRALPEDPGLGETLEKLDGIIKALSASALKNKLQENLAAHWSDKGKAALATLLSDEDTDKLADQLQDEIVDYLEEQFNTLADLWNDKPADIAAMASARLGEALHLSGSQQLKLESWINGAVTDALTEFQTTVNDKVTHLVKTDDIETLLRPWTFLGEHINAAIEGFSATAKAKVGKAREALQAIYGRYTRLRQRIIKVVQDDMEEKFSLAIISQKDRSLKESHALRLNFSQITPDIETLFKRLWSADLQDLRPLLGRINQAPGTIALSGEYRSLAELSSKFSLNIAFFGLKLSASTLFSSTVEVAIDYAGKLLVASSKAELMQNRSRWGENQSIAVQWHIDYLQKKLLEAPITLKLAVADDQFRKHEAERFYGTLESHQLIRSGIRDDILAMAFPDGKNKSVKHVRMEIALALSWEDWLSIAGRSINGSLYPQAWEPDAIGEAFINIVQNMEKRVVRNATEYQQDMGYPALQPFLLALASRKEKDARNWVGDRYGRAARPAFVDTWKLATAVEGLNVNIRTLRSTWGDITDLLPDSPDHALSEAELALLRTRLEKLNQDIAGILTAVTSAGAILDDPGKITWLTAATLKLLVMHTRSNSKQLVCRFESPATGKVLLS